MATAAQMALIAAGLWLGVAAVAARLPTGRRGRAAWVLILTGVPLLGGLTLYWGPSAGIGLFGAGVLLLVRLSPAARPVRRTRPGRPAPGPRRAAPLSSGPLAAAGEITKGQMR